MFIKKPNSTKKILDNRTKKALPTLVAGLFSSFFTANGPYWAAVNVNVTTICTPVVARKFP